MSASASKKKRKELDQQGLNAKQQAEKKAKDKKKKTLKNVLIVAAVILVIAGIIFGVTRLVRSQRAGAVVATVGKHEITVPTFNFFYNTVASNYGQLYQQVGMLEAGKPLSQQSMGDGTTYEDFFINTTKTNIQQVYNVYDAAINAGYTLTEDDKLNIQQTVESMKAEATLYGASDPDDYMALRFGSYCDMDNFEDYLTVCQYYNSYTQYKNDSFAPSDDEISKEYAENPNSYDIVKLSYAKYSAESETDEDGNKLDPTDEAIAAAKAQAEEAEKEFPETATAASGNYKTVNGQVPEEAADWLFDTARKEGDIKLFTANEGLDNYVVRFESRDDNDYKRPVGYVITISKDTDEDEDVEKSALVKFNALKNGITDGMSDDEFTELLSANDFSNTSNPISRSSYTEQIQSYLNDSSRKAGDTTTFEDDNAYYVVRYQSTEEQTYRTKLVSDALQSASQDAWFDEVTQTNLIVVDQEKLALANTDLVFNDTSSDSAE